VYTLSAEQQGQAEYISFLETKATSTSTSTTKQDSQTINGKIKINGMAYKTICECGQAGSKSQGDQSSDSSCDPSKFKIS
jgi:hypothetical protein